MIGAISLISTSQLEMAINLPIAFLQHPESLESLCQQMPDHPAFEGLIVEIDGTEVIRNLELVKESLDSFDFTRLPSRLTISGWNGRHSWDFRLSFRRVQSRSKIRHRLRRRPVETSRVPPNTPTCR